MSYITSKGAIADGYEVQLNFGAWTYTIPRPYTLEDKKGDIYTYKVKAMHAVPIVVKSK